VFENVFETANSGFAQALYEDYLKDPSSVPEAWRRLFDNGLKGARPASEEATRQSPETDAIDSTPIQGPALRLLQNMEDSLSIPTATSFRDIDVSKLWHVRAAFNRALEPQGHKLSFTHFIGWAIVLTMQEFPVMGHAVARLEDGPHRVEPESVNLGLAVDVEGKDGRRKLMVPVIKAADQMDFHQYHTEYERLVSGARDGKLLPDAYVGGTITLTNPGTIGTVASVPRLMKGQGSIIATGAIRTVAESRVMTVSSTYDHRIIQGAESGMFLRALDRLLQGEGDFYRDISQSIGVAVSDAPDVAYEAILPSKVPAGGLAAEVGDAHQERLAHVAAAMALVGAHRTHGYLAAKLDPLGTDPIGDPALHPKYVGLTPEVMAQIPTSVLGVCIEGETLAEVLPKLQETYCGTIAYEVEHIASHQERAWLRCVIESGDHRVPLSTDEKRVLLRRLIQVAGLEEFLHRTYLGQKRFGIEGLEVLVPILTEAIELVAGQGAHDVVMGMAHRGRLNVLTHVLHLPYTALLAEFEGGHDTHDTLAGGTGTGDVKYHYGASGTFESKQGRKLDVILMPNPSHLEAVNPVVEGHVRASQTDRSSRSLRHDGTKVVPILMHGDAAFAGQGVVAETLNLACLEAYDTGGTLHIITNNQVGFTTEPSDARSTDFASDLAKGFDIPIIHVNADDPEACIASVRLCMMYREKFHSDCVINLVGYRRFGHNEGDEPRYTQPQMYKRIDAHPPVVSIYGSALVAQGIVTEQEIEQEMNLVHQQLSEALARVKADQDAYSGMQPVVPQGAWSPASEPDTRVEKGLLQDINRQLLRVPEGFAVNRKLQRVLDRRVGALDNDGQIDWAHAEILALGSLLIEGVPIRMVGQDTVRGTFSQRHLALYDADTGRQHVPLKHLDHAAAPLELHNSPLSEYGALGFEYGYSVAAPETLVVWEAQFGDFANTAEVIIDQFIIGGLAKWAQTSRLTLLLPHGYEGQGPEHSSARLERYLALGVEDNIRVANCSTPAQYFHLLRRQAKHQRLRPLILMTPKSLLRHPQATSRPSELSDGGFHEVLDDPATAGALEKVTRIVFCSGKVFYDALASPLREKAKNVAIARIELLYPFPEDAVSDLIARYPRVREIVWLQEEPANMGARKWIIPHLTELAPEWAVVSHVARPERSSPAEGYLRKHQEEQAKLVAKVLGPPIPIRTHR